MAFREVTLQEVKEVVRLWRARVPKKRIAAQLGLDIKTVRRYVRALERGGAEPDLDAATGAIVEAVSSARGRPRGEGWERCEAHRAFIKGKLDQRVRLTKVRKLLKRMCGVEISYMTLYRFAVEELNFGRGASTIPVADCGPGEEVQLDIDPTRKRSPRDKARVERAVQTVQDDCYAGELLFSLEHTRDHGRHWCLEDYGMRRHRTTQRLPREHFEAVERPALLPAPSEPYDIPTWSRPKVGRDQHAQVAEALYSLPRHYRGHYLDARADRHTVRFYQERSLVKTHPRVGPGQRQTDAADFPPDKAAYALRDVAFLARKAAEHGDSVGRFATKLLEGPLPWARMRRVYALLGLARRYGDERLEEACALAVDADMIDVYRVKKLLELAPPTPTSSPPRGQLIPIARFLRPAEQYALPLHNQPKKGDPA